MAGPVLWLNTDGRLLERIRRGDEAVLEDLYRLGRRMVHAYIRQNSGTADDAEDVLQEGLVILWERVRSGSYEPTAKVTTFLYGIVKNLWLRRLARLRREHPSDLAEHDPAADDPSPLDELMASEQARRVQEAMTRLGEPCRRLLLLFYYEEQSMEEIAHSLGFANADTAKSKKYQCKKALERLLKGD